MTKPPVFIEIRQAGDLVAVCTAARVYLGAVVEAMPNDHPDKARIMCKAMIAGLILSGRVPGPYIDDVAEWVADLMSKQ